MEYTNYPENFYDFSHGLNISDEELRAWISEGLKYIEAEAKKGVVNPATSSYSGNGRVHINAHKQGNGLFTVNVMVTLTCLMRR